MRIIRFVKQEEEIAISQIKQAIVEYGKNIAALIIEPIQAEGGDNHFQERILCPPPGDLLRERHYHDHG